MRELLDPTNDYVFKRLFVEAPELLVALNNDLRPDLPHHPLWRRHLDALLLLCR